MPKTIFSLLTRQQAAIMGIINVTPDSFSDGGQFLSKDAALQQAQQLISDGADILDIGGESTRPGAEHVSEQQELDRVIPVIEAFKSEFDTPISLDTYKPAVMQAGISAGVSLINDVNALQESGAVELVAKSKLPVCIMHKQGKPKTMQDAPSYDKVVDEVIGFLQQRIAVCEAAGIAKQNIVIDPGIGFGKTLEHNLQLLSSVEQLKSKTACEVLIGVSRKSMIEELLEKPVDERIAASVGLAVQAVINGAKIVRVHDVAQTYDAVRSAEAVMAYQR